MMLKLSALMVVLVAATCAAAASKDATSSIVQPKSFFNFLKSAASAKTLHLSDSVSDSVQTVDNEAGDDAFIPFVARQLDPSITPEISESPTPSASVTSSVTPSPTTSITSTPSVTPTPITEAPVTPTPSTSVGAPPPPPCTCPFVEMYRGESFSTALPNGIRRNVNVANARGNGVFFTRVFLIGKRRNNNQIVVRVVVRATGRNPRSLPRIIRAKTMSAPGFQTFTERQLVFESPRRPGRYVKDFRFNDDNYCIGGFYQRSVGVWVRARYRAVSGTPRKPFTSALFNFNFYLGCSA